MFYCMVLCEQMFQEIALKSLSLLLNNLLIHYHYNSFADYQSNMRTCKPENLLRRQILKKVLPVSGKSRNLTFRFRSNIVLKNKCSSNNGFIYPQKKKTQLQALIPEIVLKFNLFMFYFQQSLSITNLLDFWSLTKVSQFP